MSHERRSERAMHDEHIYDKDAPTYEKIVIYGRTGTPAKTCEELFLLSLSKSMISIYYPGSSRTNQMPASATAGCQ